MKKIILVLCSIILIFSLCSCSNKKGIESSIGVSEEIKLQSKEEQPEIYISESQFNNFYDYINYDGISCPYSELYGIENAKKEKQKQVLTVDKHSGDYFENEKNVKADKLFDVVKHNNREYMSKGAAEHFNNELSDKQLRETCEIIADTINWGIANITGFDYQRVGCILANLKVLERNSFSLGTFNEKNYVLALTPEMIKNKSERVENVDMLALTISHETMHLMQCYCPDISIGEKDSFIGVSYTFGNLPINPLRNRWLFEASAELNATIKANIMPTTYQYMIDNLETINLAKILNNKSKPRELEKFSFTNGTKQLYEYLEFSNENKSIEFLYAIELLREKPEDFKAAYEEKNGLLTEDYQEFIKKTYNPYFVEVTSKLFYKNLAKRLVDDKIPLNDVFYLISLYEMDLLKDIPLDNKSVREKYSSIYCDYLLLQEEFFSHIQKNIDIDVKDAFAGYYVNYIEGSIYANADLGWIEPEKKKYLLWRNKCLYDDNFKNICTIE